MRQSSETEQRQSRSRKAVLFIPTCTPEGDPDSVLDIASQNASCSSSASLYSCDPCSQYARAFSKTCDRGHLDREAEEERSGGSGRRTEWKR